MSEQPYPVSDLTRSWLLKMLVPLNGCKEFLTRPLQGSHLVQALGMELEQDGLEYLQSSLRPRQSLLDTFEINWDDLIGGKHTLTADRSRRLQFSMQDALPRLHTMYQANLDSKQLRVQDTQEDILEHNLQVYDRLFYLGATAVSILRLAVMIKTDEALQEAIDFLGNLKTTGFNHAMSLLLDLPWQAISKELLPRARLYQFGIMSHAFARYHHNNREHDLNEWLGFCDDDLPEKLRCQKLTREDILHEYATPVPATRLKLEDYQRVSGEVETLLGYLRLAMQQGDQRGLNIFIQGFAGTGKTELARLVAQTLEVPLYAITQEDEDGDSINSNHRLKCLVSAQKILAGHKALLVMDECEEMFHRNPFTGMMDQSIGKAWMNRLLEENELPTLWISNQPISDPAFVRRFDLCIALDAPGKQERQKVLHGYGSQIGLTSELDYLAKSQHLTPAVIENAVKVVARTSMDASAEQKAVAVDMIIGNTMQAQGLPVPSSKSGSFDLGYDPSLCSASEQLAKLVPALARERSGRILLQGPPGTGKTAFGLWLGDQLHMPVEQVKASDLLSPYVGVAEQNMAKAFRNALKQGAILQIDEMDSFLQDRRQAHRSWEITEVNEMLTQMEDFAGILIATTNFNTRLDQAALRRFDMKIEMGWLQPAAAQQLLVKACRLMQLGKPSAPQLEAVGQIGNLAPGDFAAVCRKGRLVKYAGCGDLLATLIDECRMKETAPKPIGFN